MDTSSKATKHGFLDVFCAYESALSNLTENSLPLYNFVTTCRSY